MIENLNYTCMSSLLHITNGDHFTEKLKSLKLKGDIITWREMLCEGQTLTISGQRIFLEDPLRVPQ